MTARFRHIRRPLLALAAAAALLAPAGAARAGVASVADYYEDSDTVGCINTPICQVIFAKTPADSFVTVGFAHCRVKTKVPLQGAGIAVVVNPGEPFKRFAYVAVPQPVVSGSWLIYAFSYDVSFVVSKGRHPVLQFLHNHETDAYIACSIIGRRHDGNGTFF